MSYLHISQAHLDLAMLVPDCPAAVLPLFHKAARDAVLADFPEYHGIHEEVFVRITELPIEDSIRELRCGARLSGPTLGSCVECALHGSSLTEPHFASVRVESYFCIYRTTTHVRLHK